MNNKPYPFFIVFLFMLFMLSACASGYFLVHLIRDVDAREEMDAVMENKISKYTEPMIHAYILYIIDDPDKDNDGLVDIFVEPLIYKSDPKKFDSLQEGVGDGAYIYSVYKEACRTGDFDLSQYGTLVRDSIDPDPLSLQSFFDYRGAESYNFLIGFDNEIEESLKNIILKYAEGDITATTTFAKLDDLLTQYPEHPIVLFYMGVVHAVLGQNQQALDVYISLHESEQLQSPLLLQAIAWVYFDLGDTNQFLTYLDLSIEKYPLELSQYSTLANYYIEKGQIDQAEQILQKGLVAEPRYAEFYNMLANIASNNNDTALAFELYTKAVEHDFRYSAGHHNLSLIHDQNFGDLENAYIEACIALALDESGQHIGHMMLLSGRMGKFEQAEELRTQLLENENLNGVELNELGYYYLNNREYDLAEEYLLKAIEVSPGLKNAHNNLGIVYFKLKDYEKAEEQYNMAIEIDPLYARAHSNMGYMFLMKGFANQNNKEDFLAAIPWLERAIELDSEWYLPYLHLGRAYLFLATEGEGENLDNAKMYLLRSVELRSDVSMTHFMLGLLYDKYKQRDKAEAAYEEGSRLEDEERSKNMAE